ncbi:DUF4225 domain-containing protein [Serratia marcescens]|uniref:DUF4225 domain-containing protein n=2 Tax=Serratia TaxID=613 RepID=A0AB33G6J9_SERMA|nr:MULTISPECIES: DUF4225 domain-containing protein [Serratia]AKL43373.1 hypothetical protein AB188_23850 [Serratia marcescens]AWL70734.1 DUF4225 domain-containing protein [Serratia marcescens]EGT3593179.1 DUF4225 domain-containing protein [Serratia marcescens]EHT9932400.1 DUF4225 domain-containing protein [Serratia marcescens]EIJ6672326.1 DUF4225 domain-containing protein [Serratia marcescens]
MQYKTKADLDRSIDELKKLSRTFSRQYLYTNESRANFSLEIDQLIQFAKRDISIHCTSYAGAIRDIEDETNHLKRQAFAIDAGRNTLYISIEKKKSNNTTNLILKQIGFVGGGTQIFAGVGTCAATLGMACGSFGLPLIAQGTNNIYENGYYLLFRKDKSGSVRNAYRYTAKALGYSQDTADTIYGTVDLSLSGYGIIRKTLKPDAWRLYRYINSDFIRGWQEMGRTGLTIEVISDLTTGSGMYELIKDNQRK